MKRRSTREDPLKQKAMIEFSEFLVRDRTYLLEMFMDKVTSEESQEIGSALFYTFDSYDRTKTIQEASLKRLTKICKTSDALDESLRGTDLPITILSRSVQTYGASYLKKTLNPILKKIVSKKQNFEIQSTQDKSNDMKKNLDNLLKATESVFSAIVDSFTSIPFYLKDTVVNTYIELNKVCQVSKEKIVASIIFLRFICPYIVSPMIKDEINKENRRNLILIAKVIQLIANQIISFETNDTMSVTMEFVKEQTPKFSLFCEKLLDVCVKCDHKVVNTRSSKYLEASASCIFTWLSRKSEEIETYIMTQKGLASLEQLQKTMNEVRQRFGSDPASAQDYKKVWQRLQSKLGSRINSSVQSKSSDDVLIFGSSESSFEYDDIDESTNEKIYADEYKIIKVYFEKQKTFCMKVLEQETKFSDLLEWIQDRFNLEEDQPFQIKTSKNKNSSLITDEADYCQYINEQGQSGPFCKEYLLWIEG